MFACLYLPRPVNALPVRAEGRGQRADPPYAALVQIARDFSPRVETHGDRTVTLDISGLTLLFPAPSTSSGQSPSTGSGQGPSTSSERAIGEALRRATADAGLRVHIAVAATSTTAIVLAHARAGLTVVPVGEEAKALAPLPLRTLSQLDVTLQAQSPTSKAQSLELRAQSREPDQLLRWGLRTLGDLAALPSTDLSARLGQNGLRWQRWARGEDARPLVPAGVTEAFEQSLDLEWPIEGLEPLSFVLARLFEPLCDRLEREDRGSVALHIRLLLVTRQLHERSVELPAPIRDARVLRTLALLDLESNPPPAAIDRVTVGVDVTEGRVLQFELFARALPTETRVTLLARLGALMGSDRVGAPALVDTYRPGAFAMATFAPPLTPNPQSPIPHPRLCTPDSGALRRGSQEPSAAAARPVSVLRRFRSPIPARVLLEQGWPMRVTTDRRGLSGGRVERCEGPWRSSGDWWTRGWNCDEWEVTLSDGSTYRLSQTHDDREGQMGRLAEWQIEGLVD